MESSLSPETNTKGWVIIGSVNWMKVRIAVLHTYMLNGIAGTELTLYPDNSELLDLGLLLCTSHDFNIPRELTNRQLFSDDIFTGK